MIEINGGNNEWDKSFVIQRNNGEKQEKLQSNRN